MGLIARRAADYRVLVREVTAARVARHFRGMITGPVERFELCLVMTSESQSFGEGL